jgi:drug/metabolite transporter (DMT)-like permease
MSIWLAAALVTLCSLCWDIGVILQKRAADRLPPLRPGPELVATLGRFARSRGWVGGLVVTAAGWGLFAWALSATPVSLARSIQGIGFVVLALLSVVFLDHRLKLIEWAAVAVVTAGVVALGLSEPGAGAAPTPAVDLARLGLGAGVAASACAALGAARRARLFAVSDVVAVSAVAGVLLGVGDALTRAVMVELEGGKVALALGAIGPALVVAYLGGFFTLSRAYQHGRAIVATGVSDLCGRVAALSMGLVALEEPLPAGALERGLRLAGFGAVLAGTALLARFSGEGLTRERSAAPACEPAALP